MIFSNTFTSLPSATSFITIISIRCNWLACCLLSAVIRASSTCLTIVVIIVDVLL